MFQAPLGATSPEYAAPTGLKFILVLRFYKYAAPLALGSENADNANGVEIIQPGVDRWNRATPGGAAK